MEVPMTQRKDVVTFADIMENLDQIPKGDPFARGRGPVDPLRKRAMADALAAPQLAERVRELEAECERMRTFAAQNFSTMIRQEAEQMREYGLSYEGVRKVLREHDDGEISFGKLMDLIRAAARAMAWATYAGGLEMIDLDEIEARASRRSDSFADREEFNRHARTDVPAFVARVWELEAERDGYARSHAILRAIHGALTDALPNTPIPALDSFDAVELVRGLATECTALRREIAALMDDH